MGARHYAGIGSRETPGEVLAEMATFAARMAARGWICRSGGADGADTAFEQAVPPEAMQLMLPWRGFNGRQLGHVLGESAEQIKRAMQIAAAHHPAWGRCSLGARRLHARNVMQVLGPDLSSPSEFIACWARGHRLDAEGRVADVPGGTGMAVRIAATHGIPVLHFGIVSHREALGAMAGGEAVSPARQTPRQHAGWGFSS